MYNMSLHSQLLSSDINLHPQCCRPPVGNIVDALYHKL